MSLFDELQKNINDTKFVIKTALVTEVTESYIKTQGPNVSVGSLFLDKQHNQSFEVMKSSKTENILMPLDGKIKLSVGDFLLPYAESVKLPDDLHSLKGLVIDAFGHPMGGTKLGKMQEIANEESRVNPLERMRVTEKIETGIKSIDGLLTIGRGQKIGIFAGSGVGKSTLMSMLARQSSEEVNVIALIGERGREVREFIERDLGEEGLKRSVVVVATSDETPLKQMRAAELATTIAERFRSEGKKVLLMMDSITRYMMAKRAVDIANGEVPIMGGKTVSMEPSLQKLLERSGNDNKGSITGIYTVLVEGEDFESPIPDMARGILDGHIVLTRKLADQNHFPAVDVLASISRVMQDIVDPNHLQLSREIKKQLSLYKEKEDQIDLGLIESGKNPEVDRAIRLKSLIDIFLQQGMEENISADVTLEQMRLIATRK